MFRVAPEEPSTPFGRGARIVRSVSAMHRPVRFALECFRMSPRAGQLLRCPR